MPKAKPETFPARLIRLRAEAGLTQRGLAGEIGVAQKSIYQWEVGIAEPRLSNLQSLAAALGLTVGELLGEEPAS